MKIIRLLTCAILICLAIAPAAHAHAYLDHALPAVGSKTKKSLKEVKLWFSEKLEPSLSKAQIFTSDGTFIVKQVSRLDPANPSLLIISLPDLKPGKYRVVWKVVSVDTHVTKGDFPFEIIQ